VFQDAIEALLQAAGDVAENGALDLVAAAAAAVDIDAGITEADAAAAADGYAALLRAVNVRDAAIADAAAVESAAAAAAAAATLATPAQILAAAAAHALERVRVPVEGDVSGGGAAAGGVVGWLKSKVNQLLKVD
jgi:hypothetical protein